MNLVVPTVWCKCTIRSATLLGGIMRAPGEIIDLPYGVALQGIAQGVIGVLVDADDKHLEALEQLAIYGGDAWFPAHLQTIGRVKDYFNGSVDIDRAPVDTAGAATGDEGV